MTRAGGAAAALALLGAVRSQDVQPRAVRPREIEPPAVAYERTARKRREREAAAEAEQKALAAADARRQRRNAKRVAVMARQRDAR